MDQLSKGLSVAETASLCGVGHGTVGYWIRSKGLFAHRAGKNYTIPVEELVCFLRATDQAIPEDIKRQYAAKPCFKTFQPCWQYWRNSEDEHNCDACTVFKNRVEICFTAKECGAVACLTGCHDCAYYMDIYFPRLQFIHQIALPAFVYQGLHLWEANEKLTALCGFDGHDLPGIGIERVFHQESLENVLSNLRRRALGDSNVSTNYSVSLKHANHRKIKVDIAVCPLDDPSKTFLIIVGQNGEGRTNE